MAGGRRSWSSTVLSVLAVPGRQDRRLPLTARTSRRRPRRRRGRHGRPIRSGPASPFRVQRRNSSATSRSTTFAHSSGAIPHRRAPCRSVRHMPGLSLNSDLMRVTSASVSMTAAALFGVRRSAGSSPDSARQVPAIRRPTGAPERAVVRSLALRLRSAMAHILVEPIVVIWTGMSACRRERRRREISARSAGTRGKMLRLARGADARARPRKARFLLRPHESLVRRPWRSQERDRNQEKGPDREPPRPATAVVDLLDARRHRPPRLGDRQRRRDAVQRRPAHSAPLRHRRLLRLPARPRPLEPDPRRHHRPEARQRRPDPHAARRRPGRPRRRGAAAADRGRRAVASALQVLQGRRRGSVSLVPRRPAHRPRPAAGRAGGADRHGAGVRSRRWSRRSARPGTSSRTSSAWPAPRGSSSRRRRSACAAWPATCGGAGTRTRPACSATSIPACGAVSGTTRSRCCSSCPVSTIDERASQLALHGRINYAYRRLEEYLGSRDTWGERHAGVLRTRPVAYFSAEFGLHESLPIYSGGLGILSGDHIKAASDLGIPLVGVGLYYDQGYFRQRLDDEMCQQEEYLDVDAATLPIRPATTKDGRTVTVSVETRTGTDLGARVDGAGRPQHAAAPRLGRRGQPARGSRADGAALRRRRAGPHPPGAAARRRRRAGAARARLHAGRRPPERRPQRVRGARVRAPADGARGPVGARGAARRRLAHRLHDPHAGAGRPRSLLAGSRRGAPRAAARGDGPRPRGAARLRPRRSAATRTRRSA